MIVDVLSTIGKTPLVRLNNITSPDESEVVLKYEKVNPGGSIKDRPANYIIMEARFAKAWWNHYRIVQWEFRGFIGYDWRCKGVPNYHFS